METLNEMMSPGAYIALGVANFQAHPMMPILDGQWELYSAIIVMSIGAKVIQFR